MKCSSCGYPYAYKASRKYYNNHPTVSEFGDISYCPNCDTIEVLGKK